MQRRPDFTRSLRAGTKAGRQENRPFPFAGCGPFGQPRADSTRETCPEAAGKLNPPLPFVAGYVEDVAVGVIRP